MTDDAGDSPFTALGGPERDSLLRSRRYVLTALQGGELAFAPGTSREDIARLCADLALLVAGEIAGNAQFNRHLSSAEADEAAIARMQDEITELEMLALDDGVVPFPGGQPLPESAMRDGDVTGMPPEAARASLRLWRYVADVAVEGRRPRLPRAELRRVAEGLAGLVLGLVAGQHAAAGAAPEDAQEAAARHVLTQRDLYGSLGAGD